MISALYTRKVHLIWHILVYCLAGVIVLLGVSCQINPSPTPIEMPTFDPNEDISFDNQPHWLRMFHINPEVNFGNRPVLLTWYTRPYQNGFDVVLISENGTVKIFSEFPTWARQGGILPIELKSEEHQKVNEMLQSLSKIESPRRGNDAVVIVLSFESTLGRRQMISCIKSTCPAEVKEIFEIVHIGFKQRNDYNLPFMDE